MYIYTTYGREGGYPKVVCLFHGKSHRSKWMMTEQLDHELSIDEGEEDLSFMKCVYIHDLCWLEN